MKKINQLLFVLLSISAAYYTSCTSGIGKKEVPKTDTISYVNITILLDLSDRIANVHHGQIERDTSIIRNILTNFCEIVKQNGYNYSKDNIQILIAPQSENDPIKFNPNIDIDKEAKNNKTIRQVLPKLISSFMQDVKSIYSNPLKYTGADIWTFFRDFAERDCIKKSYSENGDDGNVFYRCENKMIILTDGYLNFDPTIQSKRIAQKSCMQVEKLRNDNNWESNFTKYEMDPIPNKDFKNLDVLMLEINPYEPQLNPTEFPIIEKYWKTWFSDMKVKISNIHQVEESIPLINSSVSAFLKDNN